MKTILSQNTNGITEIVLKPENKIEEFVIEQISCSTISTKIYKDTSYITSSGEELIDEGNKLIITLTDAQKPNTNNSVINNLSKETNTKNNNSLTAHNKNNTESK